MEQNAPRQFCYPKGQWGRVFLLKCTTINYRMYLDSLPSFQEVAGKKTGYSEMSPCGWEKDAFGNAILGDFFRIVLSFRNALGHGC